MPPKKRRKPRPQQISRSEQFEGFARRLLRAWPALLLTLLLTLLFALTDVPFELEYKIQDLRTRFMTTTPVRSEVVVVLIDDNDYKQLFQATSPLKPEMLQSLISAIAKGNPKVIGVDVATSDTQFRERFKAEDWWKPPIVWANSVYDFAPGPETNEEVGRPVPMEVLGGNGPRPNKDRAGLPTLIDDDHNVTRFYQRVVQTDTGTQRTFPRAVAKTYRPALGGEETTARLFIKYAGDKHGTHRRLFSASEALALQDDPLWLNPTDGIRDKIVLLGGNYLGADQHSTPLGSMNGVHVLATVVENELSGGGDPQPPESSLLPLWIAQAVGLVLVSQFFPLFKAPLKNLGISLGLLLISSLAGSIIAGLLLGVSVYGLVGYFIPIGLAVLLVQILGYVNDWRKERLARFFRPETDEPGAPSQVQRRR